MVLNMNFCNLEIIQRDQSMQRSPNPGQTIRDPGESAQHVLRHADGKEGAEEAEKNPHGFLPRGRGGGVWMGGGDAAANDQRA